MLISHCAENALAAFDAAGVAYPKFIGFGDTGAYMQKMLEINKDEIVTSYMVLSNPPGVGATGLNFALNLIMGKTLKDGVYAAARKTPTRFWIPSKVMYTDQEPGGLRGLCQQLCRWRLHHLTGSPWTKLVSSTSTKNCSQLLLNS